jgi:hypothetical protein
VVQAILALGLICVGGGAAQARSHNQPGRVIAKRADSLEVKPCPMPVGLGAFVTNVYSLITSGRKIP